jgi:hypothetical protein
MSSNVTERINRLQDAEYNCELRLLEAKKNLDTSKKTIVSIIKELQDIKAERYPLEGKDVRDIAGDIIHKLRQLDMVEYGTSWVYECINDDYKQENVKQLFKRYAFLLGKEEDLNISPEQEILEEVKAIKEKMELLPEGRKRKINNQVSTVLKEEEEEVEDIKEEDFGIHQAEPPEGMQGPNAFSMAVRDTADWFTATGKHYHKIADEIETYKPMTEERIQEKAVAWVEFIQKKIIYEVLDPIFNTETQAEADRKWSTSVFHWIGIIKNRIEQSKHGAGKMAENTLTSPFGKIVYNHKNKAIKKPISRERVGDFERPVVDMAIKIISANEGLVQLHDWLENDQGGYRRYRKEFLHDYFAEASMGSIKSGNPEYPQFMREYKKKQLEKFKQ